VVFMLIGGVAGLAIPGNLPGWRSVAAGLFGIGAALVLDEFALILHLDDVYWSEKGRTSIDAVFVAVAFSGLLLLGVRPIGVDDFLVARSEDQGSTAWIVGAVAAIVNLSLAGITLLKGKIWTGLIGLWVPVLIFVGAIRLARPHSPWARWRYTRASRRAQRKMARAVERERRVRGPLIAAKIRFQDLIAGRPDLPSP
jgi:hypothetical protein